ncbi:AI-2E family transporter [Pseudarthrobacter sp. J75]|uniref:AI-2E family transporter n=1 Tax=unclassified Pseudarthrobacter TaxID=2647000 RepID=UPI002E81AA04|nr:MULTISPECIES: AI-2E family transporter [unclassified Pseudarthrobacter]MEE2523949.1 AI-2E family transporter [Pseudarthrobacter sp. J47]MEE2528283.1 AI-2E family transporter [Pseudarthrobacter sp. J75]MEE2567985.1 AI-2E family transporter [Pseudarthrobacter sp. J64]
MAQDPEPQATPMSPQDSASAAKRDAAQASAPASTPASTPIPTPKAIWNDGLGRVATRAAQVLLVLTVAVVSIYALIQIKLLVIPILIALILAAAIGPFVNLLRRRGIPGGLATGIAFVGLLLVLAGVSTVIYRSVRSQWGELATQAASGLDELEQFLLTGPIPVDREQLEQGRQAIIEFATSSQVRSGAITGLSMVTEFIAGASLMVIVLFFFLKDGAKIWNFFLRPFSGQREAKLRRVGSRTLEVLGGYVRGTAVVALVDTVAIGAALLILQVPLAIPLAIIVFLGAFIPLVGATIAGILAALVALVANGPVVALIVVAVVIAVNQLEGDLLQPIVMGKSLQLHALVILMALTAGTIVAGIVGAVLSVPLAAVAWAILQVWTAEDPNLEDLNPDLPPANTKPT